jgi:hypothetical protein
MAAPPGGVLALAEALGLAASSTFSIRHRTSEAVSGLVDQIGFKTANTSSVAITSTSLTRNSAGSPFTRSALW